MKMLEHLHKVILAIVVAVGMNYPAPSFAWGNQGHQVVAQIAWDNMTPAARATVTRLLAQEPGENIVSIATWADEHRNRETAKWHFINFERGNCIYEPATVCPNGQCAVEAINRQYHVLQSRSASDLERLVALKYIVHVVGDVSQPLHAGYYEDKGGNDFQISARGMRSRNLHALWDSGMIETVDRNPGSLARNIEIKMQGQKSGGGTPAQWAMESCRIVQATGFYPSSHRLDQDYFVKWWPVAEYQLYAGGMRLAALLNGLQ